MRLVRKDRYCEQLTDGGSVVRVCPQLVQMMIAYRIRLTKGGQHSLKALDLRGLLRYISFHLVILCLQTLGVDLPLVYSRGLLLQPLLDTAGTR